MLSTSLKLPRTPPSSVVFALASIVLALAPNTFSSDFKFTSISYLCSLFNHILQLFDRFFDKNVCSLVFSFQLLRFNRHVLSLIPTAAFRYSNTMYWFVFFVTISLLCEQELYLVVSQVLSITNKQLIKNLRSGFLNSPVSSCEDGIQSSLRLLSAKF